MYGVEYMANQDISKYFKNRKTLNNKKEIWDITLKSIFTKQSRKLNHLLGLHKINKQ